MEHKASLSMTHSYPILCIKNIKIVYFAPKAILLMKVSIVFIGRGQFLKKQFLERQQLSERK
jgi:hypothetical protein